MDSIKALCGEVRVETVMAAGAVSRWRALRAQVASTGLYPLLLGPPDDLEFIEIGESTSWTHDEVIKNATQQAIDAHIAGRKQDASELAAEGIEYPERGEWPDEPGGMDDAEDLAILRDYEGDLLEELLLAHVPGHTGAEAIGALGYGAWNDCPVPSAHVAYLRRWQERWGAELVVCANDTVEFFVERPPTTREAAIELAIEQFWYCADIVDQGAGTIEALANTLLNAPRWFFWWD